MIGLHTWVIAGLMAFGSMLYHSVAYAQEGEMLEQNAQAAPSQPQASIPFKDSSTQKMPSATTMGGVIILLLAAGFTVVFFIKKGVVAKGAFPSDLGGKIRIVDRKALHGGHYIYLLDIEGKSVTTVVGPQQSSMAALNEVLPLDDKNHS